MQQRSQRRRDASHRRTATTVRVIAWTGLVLVSSAARAQTALPQGGSVVSGQARINAASNALTINQTTSRAIVDWNSFSVGQSGSVSFIQPNASSAILNRVTGSTSSTIAGEIAGNGQVFLVNPNGIAITPSGTVQVGGGFVGSTLDIRNADFNTGNLSFTGNGASAGVSNAGAITSAPGGFVGLIGGTVSNAGTIRVPLGKVGLGSGERATLDPTGDGFLQVAVPTGAVAADGRALVDVSGHVRAAGGSIEIKAATAQQAARDAVNVSGALSARSVSGRNGSIVLGGGDGGNVVVSGTLSATGGRKAQGGSITVTGANIGLRGALVDVSGGSGGGTVRIGGGPHGSGPLQRASTTSVDSASLIRADATVDGNGGNVTVWSDQATSFAGHISARGGAAGGNGGQAEVSGESQLSLTGDYSQRPLADLTALRGTTGTLLFDPGTVIILNQSTLDANKTLNGPDTFTAQFISSQLNSANVSINTNNATGANGSAGDIDLLAGAQISWSNGNILALQAARNINFAAGSSITSTGAGALLELRSGYTATGTGTVNFSGANQVSLTNGGEVDIYYNPASNSVGGSNSNAGIAVNATSYSSAGAPASENWSSFVTAGTTILPLMLVNTVYDLQNINNNLSGNYALSQSINASATSGWNAAAGFLPIGTTGTPYTGQFYGLGQTISGLTINRGGTNNVGLFGATSGAHIDRTGLTNLSVVGATNVGGLVGTSAGTSVNQSVTTGTVTGTMNVGGLVGTTDNSSGMLDSYSTTTVHASGSGAGGLVGSNAGAIVTSYAAGATSSSGTAGGLVGTNSSTGTVSQSYFDTTATGQGNGIGVNNNGANASVTAQTTAQLQDGSVPAAFDPTIWTATSGVYPSLVWQHATTPSNPTPSVVITAIDSRSGNPVYGQGIPTFMYTVTNTSGTTLCTYNVNCVAYLGGSPLIDTTLSPTASAGASAPGYISKGTIGAGHTIEFVNDLLTVVPAPLTITASNQSKTYGSNLALGTTAFTTSGLVGSDSVSSVTLSSAGSGAAANAGSYAITPSAAVGTGLSNYTISYLTGVLSVNPASITVSANSGTSTYGSANPTLSATGLQNGQNVSVLTGLSASGVSNTSNVGTYTVSVAGTLTNPNYTVTSTSSGSWTVNPASVSVTALGGSSIYGASPANPGLSATGLQNGQTVSVLTGLSNSFGISNSSNAGSYTLDVLGTLTNSNYTVTSTNNGSWTVNPAQVSVTALGGSSTYGASPANPGLSATGLQNGQTVAALTGLSNSFGISNSSNAGSYALSVAGALTNSNYTVTSTNNGNWTVNPAPVGVTALGGSSTYGASPANPGLSATGLQNGQTVAALTGLSNSFGISNSSNAGSYALSVAGTLTNSNYTIASTTSGSWTVNPASISVAANSGTSTYGSANPTLSATGLQNGQTVSVLTGLSASGVSNTSNVGSYTVSVAGTLTNPNYDVTSTSSGSWTVTPASVSVTALGGSSTYGASPANPGLSATGLQNGQTVSVLTGLSNSFGISNSSNAGTYTLDVAGTLSNPNYTVTSTNNGSWTVNPAQVSVTALGGSSTYGASPANPGLSATGLQNGQTVGVLTGLSNSFGISNSSNAGSYTLNVAGTLTNSNYTVTSTNNGSWTVNPAQVSVTALGGSSTYGASPANPGLSATGLQNGQTVAALTGLSNSFGISNSSNAGTYALSVAGTLTNSNYSVASTNNGSWTVDPAQVGVTALGGFSTYGSSPSNPGLSATGLQNGQNVNVLTGLINSWGISNNSNAGTYTLDVAGALTNSNYTVASTTAGSWTVNPASISITAQGGTSTYGSSPNTGLVVTGLQNGQNASVLTGLSLSGVSSTSNVGSYTVNVTGSLTNPNYTVASTTGGSWTVDPASVSVTALGGSSTYGSSPANPGLSATGLQNGQTVAALTGLSNSFGISNSSNAGTYATGVAGALTNSNYTLASTTGGSWIVNPAPVSVTALGGTSTYGASPSNPGLSAAGLQNGQTIAALTGLSNSFGINNTSSAGTYTLGVAGALTNSNYTVAGTTGGSWLVNPAPVSVTALGGSSIYGSSPSNPGLSATGLQNGQTVAALTGLSNSFGISNNSNAGTHTLSVAGTLTNSNYTVASTTAGSWLVNPAPVSVTASSGSSFYGSANPTLSATGLQNGQNASVLTGLSASGVSNTSNVGSYSVDVAGTLTNPNYTVASTTSGSWIVNPAPISVIALGGSSFYGAAPANPGLAATGLQNGQNASILTGLRNSFGVSNTSNAGSYALDVAGTLTNPNYTVTGTTGGNWTVNPAPVIVTALGGSSTFQSAPANPGLAATGLQNGQTVGVLTGLRNSFGIDKTSPIGSYVLNVEGTLTNPNYRVASAISGSWTVAPLRGAVSDASPSIPGLSIVGPTPYLRSGFLSGLNTTSDKVNAGNPQPSQPVRTSPGGGPNNNNVRPADGIVAPSPDKPNPVIAPVDPAPSGDGSSAPASARPGGSLTEIASTANQIPDWACPGVALDPGFRLDQYMPGCEAEARKGRHGLLRLRSALARAFAGDFNDLTGSISLRRAAILCLGLTLGVWTWLLSRGGLLAAFLSTIPLWRGFDPLVILARPKRRDVEVNQPPSDIDRMFDNLGAHGLAVKLWHKLRNIFRPGIRRGGRASANAL